MKVLVLNDSESEFNLIRDSQKYTEIFHAQRYLQFLHQIEVQDWDIIYLRDEFSSLPNPDVWMDGNGFKKLFDGVHASRALAGKAKSGSLSTKKVIICSNSALADEMFQILEAAQIDVSLSNKTFFEQRSKF